MVIDVGFWQDLPTYQFIFYHASTEPSCPRNFPLISVVAPSICEILSQPLQSHFSVCTRAHIPLSSGEVNDSEDRSNSKLFARSRPSQAILCPHLYPQNVSSIFMAKRGCLKMKIRTRGFVPKHTCGVLILAYSPLGNSKFWLPMSDA
jgi:hypothetical protein